MSTSATSNIIIRLQNLPNEARAVDIRRFFAGLNIPDGGVHVVGGEKGDAFINFSSDDDARQAMVKSGSICGNPIRLFLSSRSEMQSVIAQARAAPMNKPPPTVIEQSYPSNPLELQQQDQNGANLAKLPSANAITSILAEFQAKAAQQQQQMQQPTPTMDQTNTLLMAAAQNGSSPLAIQQLLAALSEKHSSAVHHHQQQQQQQQQQHAPFSFQMPVMPNTLNPYLQPSNGSLNPQYVNAFQQQRSAAATAAAALLFQQQQQQQMSPAYGNPHHQMANNHHAPFNSTPITADEPYIRVRNIPIGYTYHNIKTLFAKYKLNLADMKIINDQNGQRTGEVVLRLHTNKDVTDLLSQDGRMTCYNALLDIKKIDEYTFASAVDSFVPAHVKKTPGATVKNCIRVTGLPKKYERKDVKRFFTGCNVTNRPGGIFIEADTVDGPTFVEFETEIDAEKAYFYNGEQMGSSTIEMYRMTKADMENEITSLKRGPSDRPSRRPPLLSHEPTLSNPRNANSSQMSMSGFPRHSDSQSFPSSMHSTGNADQAIVCLRLKNIPYTTTDQQIHEYFGGIQTPIESCKILRDRLNRGAGEALVRFHDPQACQIAYESKNRQIFYGRSLDLRPLPLFEYQNASLTPMLTVNDLQSPSTMNQHFQPGSMKRMPPYYERGDDNRRNDKRARWEGGNNNNNNNNKDGFGYPRNSPRVNRDESGQESKSLEENNASNDRRSSTPPSNSGSGNHLPPLPSELNEYIGRILVLSNVAYRATRDEILDFLRAYTPIPETLKIRCDANGKPTGFGVVACETVADASRAVSELNNQIFMSRKIFLQQR